MDTVDQTPATGPEAGPDVAADISAGIAADFATLAGQLGQRAFPAGWALVSDSPGALLAHQASAGIYYKEYPARSLAARLSAVFGRGAAHRRAQRNNARLLLAGFQAPQCLASGTLANGRDYLFISAITGESVAHWLRQALTDRDPATLALRRHLLRELGVFTGRLHAAGFIHGDLHPGNVIAAYKGGQFRFGLINTEHLLRRRPPPGKRLLAELSLLNGLPVTDLTRTDRWRCFLAWRQQQPELGHEEARLLALAAYHRAAGQ